ncbi:MAG: SDR family oxidoreductase [Tatlockia sp.]|nr:SDR family oxidoreductase [Tatlockia sp.]
MRTVMITGANRGLGLEFTRQLAEQNIQVIATCRHPAEATLLKQLAKAYPIISIAKLDQSSDKSIAKLQTQLADTAIDWLINNAGMMGDKGVTVGNINRDNFLEVMNVNCLGAIKISEALLPNLQKGHDKLIVTLSSILGNLSTNIWGHAYAYRASKAALNSVMHSLAIDVAEQGIKVMLLHPGWVRTDLGGPNALIDPEDSVTGMLNVIAAKKADCHAEVMYDFAGNVLAW